MFRGASAVPESSGLNATVFRIVCVPGCRRMLTASVGMALAKRLGQDAGFLQRLNGRIGRPRVIVRAGRRDMNIGRQRSTAEQHEQKKMVTDVSCVRSPMPGSFDVLSAESDRAAAALPHVDFVPRGLVLPSDHDLRTALGPVNRDSAVAVAVRIECIAWERRACRHPVAARRSCRGRVSNPRGPDPWKETRDTPSRASSSRLPRRPRELPVPDFVRVLDVDLPRRIHSDSAYVPTNGLAHTVGLVQPGCRGSFGLGPTAARPEYGGGSTSSRRRRGDCHTRGSDSLVKHNAAAGHPGSSPMLLKRGTRNPAPERLLVRSLAEDQRRVEHLRRDGLRRHGVARLWRKTLSRYPAISSGCGSETDRQCERFLRRGCLALIFALFNGSARLARARSGYASPPIHTHIECLVGCPPSCRSAVRSLRPHGPSCGGPHRKWRPHPCTAGTATQPLRARDCQARSTAKPLPVTFSNRILPDSASRLSQQNTPCRYSPGEYGSSGSRDTFGTRPASLHHRCCRRRRRNWPRCALHRG